MALEVTFQYKQLDEVTNADDLVFAVREHPFDTQIAYLRLPVAEAKKVMES